MATPTKIAAANASDRLIKALINVAAQGLRIHCSDPITAYLWLSEHEDERAQAAILCKGCPVEIECWSAAVARRERFAVWGGVDFTPNRPKIEAA
jgi:hypothetical protein